MRLWMKHPNSLIERDKCMRVLISLGLVSMIFLGFLSACASTQDNIFGQVPNEQNVPLNQQMPPVSENQ